MKKCSANQSIEDVLKKMKLVFSPRYGLVNRLTIEEMEHQRLKKNDGVYVVANVIPMYRTTVQSVLGDATIGCGASLTKERSQVKAFGEFIERFSATNFHDDHRVPLQYNTYADQCKLGECLDLADLIDFEDSLFDLEETRMQKYTHDDMVSWVRGTELTGGTPVWVPAQKVYLGVPLENGEKECLQWLSTGLACGSSLENATTSGIFEVIERDSFMLTWLLHLPGKRIVMDQMKNPQLKALYTHIRDHLVGDDRLYIYDISKTDGVYTVLTFIRNDNPHSYGLITSAATDVDPERALLKSLEELCLTQAFGYLSLYEHKHNIQELEQQDVQTLHMHLFYYSTGKNSREFDFIDDPGSSVELSKMPTYCTGSDECVLDYLLNLFRKAGKPVYSVDVTREEILECGLRVVKAIIPGYNDLDITYNMKLLKNKRLKEFQEKTNRHVINRAPHPFP